MYTIQNVQRTNVTNCGSRATPPPDEKLTCFYDTQEIRQLCRAEDNYGYAEGSPCIFIQFNHVANFTPEVYTKQDLDNESLPQSLRSVFLPSLLFIHFFICLNSFFSIPFSETLLPSLSRGEWYMNDATNHSSSWCGHFYREKKKHKRLEQPSVPSFCILPMPSLFFSWFFLHLRFSFEILAFTMTAFEVQLKFWS